MKNVFYGLGLQYDKGDGPSVGINVHGKVVEVHKNEFGLTLYSRVGTVNKATVNWPVAASEYTGGVEPCVAVNAGNTVVEVHKNQAGVSLYSLIGTIVGDSVSWKIPKSPKSYTTGVSPAVAVNDAGKVVEVHRSEKTTRLYYRFGRVGAENIDWKFDDKYDTGETPRVAINNRDQVVEVHRSEALGTKLWYHVGTIDESSKKINFGSSQEFASSGANPSVALTDDGVVIVTYSEGLSVLQHFGQIDIANKKINWTGGAMSYDAGATPFVAAAGRMSIEVHEGEIRKTLWFSTSIITDRATWMTDARSTLGPRKMSQLVFPASHDSAMYPPTITSLLGKTQDLSIFQQLEYGIRYYDLRPEWTGGKFIIHHGPIPGPDLTEVLRDIQRYAQFGHKELVIIDFSHFEKFDNGVYARFADEVEHYLGPWLYKKALAPGQRLADITLNDYTAGGTAIVVAVADDYAINIKRPGLWVFRDWDSTTADKGDLRVFDVYSDTTDYQKMKADQLLKFANYDGKLKLFPDLPCDLFLLSWTLTPITGVWFESKEPNRNLGQVMTEFQDPNNAGKIINMLYVDYVQYARVSDVGIIQNEVQTFAAPKMAINKEARAKKKAPAAPATKRPRA